jgi:hypothetical protein
MPKRPKVAHRVDIIERILYILVVGERRVDICLFFSKSACDIVHAIDLQLPINAYLAFRYLILLVVNAYQVSRSVEAFQRMPKNKAFEFGLFRSRYVALDGNVLRSRALGKTLCTEYASQFEKRRQLLMDPPSSSSAGVLQMDAEQSDIDVLRRVKRICVERSLPNSSHIFTTPVHLRANAHRMGKLEEAFASDRANQTLDWWRAGDGSHLRRSTTVFKHVAKETDDKRHYCKLCVEEGKMTKIVNQLCVVCDVTICKSHWSEWHDTYEPVPMDMEYANSLRDAFNKNDDEKE